MSALLGALPSLVVVAMVALRAVSMLALLAQQLFSGLLSGGCKYADPATGDWLWADGPLRCSLPCTPFAPGHCPPSFGDECPLWSVQYSLRGGAGTDATLVQTA
jgi:hypothetical protein